MTLEELQIVISVQSDQVQSQVNNVIGHINNLNSSVAASTAGVASSFSGMAGIMSNLAIGAALGKSIQAGMAQATNAVKTEMTNITNAMQTTVRATTQAINGEIQNLNNQIAKGHTVDVNVNQTVNTKALEFDTSQIQSALNGIQTVFHMTMTEMINHVAELNNKIYESNQKVRANQNYADKPSYTDEQYHSMDYGHRFDENGLHFSARIDQAGASFGQFSDMVLARVREFQSTISQDGFGMSGSPNPNNSWLQRNSGGGDSGAPGGIPGFTGQIDTDDDVPMLTQINAKLLQTNNRLSSMSGSMTNFFNRTKTNDNSTHLNELNGDMEAGFNKVVDACQNIQEELVRIKTHLTTHMNGGGGSGSPIPISGRSSDMTSGAALGAMGMGAVLRNYFAALGIGYIIKTSVTDAMSAIESESLFNTIYADQASAMRKWTNNLNSNSGQQLYNTGSNTDLKATQDLGLNPYELRENSAMMFAMSQSMGLARQSAMGLSQDMSMLANDMASFYNMSSKDAFDKLRAGLSGETEPLKRLGIIINETAVKQYAYTNGIAKQGQVLSETQKIMARYGIIMRDTAAAQGDLARTIDSPANQLRVLVTQLDMLKISLGQAFMPIVTVVLPILVSFVRWLNTAMTYVAAFMQALFGTKAQNNSNNIAAANTKVATSLGDIGKAAEKAKGSLQGFDEINQLNYNPGGGAEAAGGLGEEFIDIMPGGGDGMLDSMSNISEEMQKKIEDMVANVKKLFADIFKPFKDGWDKYGPTVKQNASIVMKDLGEMMSKVGETLKAIWVSPQMQASVQTLVGIFSALWTILTRILDEIIKPIWNAFFDMLNPEKNPAARLLLSVLEGVLKALKAVLDYLAGDGFWIVKTFLAAWAAIWVTNKIFAVGTAIAGLITAMKGFSLVTWLTTGNGMIATFIANMAKIGPWFSSLGTWMAGLIASIGVWFSGLWASISGFFAPMAAGIVAGIQGIATALGISFGAAVALVVAAVAAIIAAIWLIVANWDEICAWFEKAWAATCEWAVKAWDGTKVAWAEAGVWFKKLWAELTEAAGIFWNDIQRAATACWEAIKTTAVVAWNAIKDAWSVTKDFFIDIWTKTKETGTVFWNWMKDAGDKSWKAVKATWDVVKGYFADIWNTVKGTGTQFWNWLKDIGNQTWEGLKTSWNNILPTFKGYWDTITASGTTFWNGIKKLGIDSWTGIKGVWDTVGGYFTNLWEGVGKVVNTVWTGIKTTISNVFGDIRGLLSDLVAYVSGAFKNAWANAWNGVIDIFQTIITGISGMFRAPLNSMIDGINRFLRGLNGIEIPDWVPGVGGKTFSIPTIPRLATGGIVSKSTIAEIGEAGAEAVVPLENTSFIDKFANAIGNAVSKEIRKENVGGSNNIGDVVLNIDGRTLARVTVDNINKLQKMSGKTLLTT